MQLRSLPFQEVNVDRVLFDLDLFLREYPSFAREEKKDAKGGDLPMKTIKTIAHSLARLKGDKVGQVSIQRKK